MPSKNIFENLLSTVNFDSRRVFMAIWSFAHMKKRAVSDFGNGTAKEPSLDETLTVPVKKFKKTDSIENSEWCYGCVNFSVDAPKTKKQAMWCGRPLEGQRWEFRRILASHVISQCPDKSRVEYLCR